MKNYKNIYIVMLSRFFLTLNFIALVKEVFLQDSGISASVIVLTGFFYQVSKAIFEIPTGYFADRYGYKSSVNVGVIIQIISILTLSLATNTSSILTFILTGFGNTFISGAFDALFYENILDFDKDIKYKIINYTQYIDMGSRAIALLLTPYLISIGGYSLVIVLSIVTLVISMICIKLIKIENTKVNPQKRKDNNLSINKLKKSYKNNKEVLGYFIVRKSFTIFDIPLEKFTILLFLNKGFSFEVASLIFAISFFAYPVFSSLSNKLPTRDNDKWLLWTPLISDLCIIIFVASTNWLIAIIMYFLSSFIISSSSIHNFVKTNALISDESRATVLSIDSLIMTFTASLMYLMLSLVAENMTIVLMMSTTFALLLNVVGRKLIKK